MGDDCLGLLLYHPGWYPALKWYLTLTDTGDNLDLSLFCFFSRRRWFLAVGIILRRVSLAKYGYQHHVRLPFDLDIVRYPLNVNMQAR